MTTILKALRELEKDGAPATHGAPAATDRHRTLRWVLVALVLLALAAGAVGRVWFLPRRQASDSISNASPTAVSHPQVDPQLPAPVAPLLAAPLEEELPWGHVERSGPATPPAAAPQAPPVGVAVVQQAKPRRKVPPPQDAPGAPVSVPGEPRILVQSIVYSANPAERTVTLQIEDARPVTLREGESAGGIEVQLILRDMVYLHHGASVFAVGAAP